MALDRKPKVEDLMVNTALPRKMRRVRLGDPHAIAKPANVANSGQGRDPDVHSSVCSLDSSAHVSRRSPVDSPEPGRYAAGYLCNSKDRAASIPSPVCASGKAVVQAAPHQFTAF